MLWGGARRYHSRVRSEALGYPAEAACRPGISLLGRPTDEGALRTSGRYHIAIANLARFRDGPNTISESTVLSTELSEFFWAPRVLGRDFSESLSAYYLCASHAELAEFLAEFTEFGAELSEFSLPKQYSRNSMSPAS